MYTLSNFTIKDSKRFIGKFFNVSILYKTWESRSKIIFSNWCSLFIIKRYKNFFSEERIGTKIKKAVITVPAHFHNFQKEETIEVAKKAGLEVYQIINEPTAAAIA